MLDYFIKKAHNRTFGVRPRIVIGVPSEITQVEKRAVRDSAMQRQGDRGLPRRAGDDGARSAPGCRSPSRPATWSSTSAAARPTSPSSRWPGSSTARSVRVAGNEMDEAIIQYIKRKYNLLDRRADRRGGQDQARLGLPARRGAHARDQGTRPGRGRAEDDRGLGRGDPRGARRRPSRRSSRRCASRSSRRPPSSRRTSSTAASCSRAAERC